MIVYPAIDLRKGRCVRLRQGDPSSEIAFSGNPPMVAAKWAAEGAQWLHVVNLDGALGESAEENLSALGGILGTVKIPVQFGGGIRSLADIDRLLGMGVARVVLGTLAVLQPEVVEQAIHRYGPDRIAVGIDARGGKVSIHGWQEQQDLEATDLATQMIRRGVMRIVYTDIGRDGMLSGVNLEAIRHMCRPKLRLIASGGVACLSDLEALVALEDQGVEGVIIGMALYRGAIRLPDALRVARGESTDVS